MATTNNPPQFAILSRILHWLMAAMLLTMLFIGVSMVSSLENYHRLIWRPSAARHHDSDSGGRPADQPDVHHATAVSANHVSLGAIVATASERLLYTLMFALPLVGWGMLSAGHYPIVIVRIVASAADPPGKPDALRRTAQNAHNSGVSAVPDVSRPSQCGAVSLADPS